MSRGVIYIARNDEWDPPNRFKVGLSGYAEPEQRMRSLSATANPGKSVCKGYVLVDDVEDCERILHELLSPREGTSEYFNTPINKIVNVIRENIADKIIEDWLEDPNGRYVNMEYYDIPKNYILPKMQFDELVNNLSNLDFQKAAKFIHTNNHPTWISCGVPSEDTLRVFYLLANKNKEEEYSTLMSVPAWGYDSHPRMSTEEEINLLSEIQNIEMKKFFLLANGQNVANLLRIIGLALLKCGQNSSCEAQHRICSRELADKFKSYLWRASDETKAVLDRVEFFTPWDLDSIIEPMFYEHLR